MLNQSWYAGDVNECQGYCQHNWECNYFEFDLGKNLCWLKRSDATKSFKTNSLIGPKYCGKTFFLDLILSKLEFKISIFEIRTKLFQNALRLARILYTKMRSLKKAMLRIIFL